MVESVQKLITNYQSQLSGAELEKFNALPDDKKLSIAMVQIKGAVPTDTGALKNLEPQPKAAPPQNVFEPRIKTENYWSVQKSGTAVAPYKDEEVPPTGTVKTPIKSKDEKHLAESKTTQYAVQLGDSVEGVVKKSLKAQNIANPDEKQLKEATDKFIKDNEGLVKTNKKGVKFLSAGSTVKLDGEVDVTHNKSAQQVAHAWAKKYTKPATGAPAAGTAVDPKSGKAVENPAVDPPKDKGKNVTPSAEEIKGITAEKGGYFLKNTKTGNIVQVYSDKYGREVATYDKDKKLIQQEEYHSDKSSVSKYYKNGVVTATKIKYADGSGVTEYGTAHVSVGNRKVGDESGRKIETDKSGKETHYIKVKDESQSNKGVTKWVVDPNPPKAKATPAPVAAADSTKTAPPVAPVANAAAADKGKNVTPSAEEIKGIKAEDGGYFIKNTKTGNISQVYSDATGREVDTYNAKTYDLIQADRYNSDGSSSIQYGKAHVSVGKKYFNSRFARGIVKDKNGKETHYIIAKDESKPNQGETKWVVDKNPPKAKATPAPAAAADSTKTAPPVAPVANAAAADKGKNVTPSAEEIKGIKAEKGGYFLKNTKTGNIVQVYSDKYGREVATYDKDKKLIQQDEYHSDKSSVSKYYKNGVVTATKIKYADGSGVTEYGTAHVSVGNRKVGDESGRKIETDKSGKETHYIKVKDESQSNKGVTKWVVDPNPPKAKATPAPVAAADSTKTAPPVAPVANAAAADKGKNVTPSAEEIKGIEAEDGGYFIKNTKTGNIVQVYSDEFGREVDTYDAKTKKLIQEDTYYLNKVSTTDHYDKNDIQRSHIQRNADGSSVIVLFNEHWDIIKHIEKDKNGKEIIGDN